MSKSDQPRHPSIVRRARPVARGRFSWSDLHPARVWETLKPYFGLGRIARPEPIVNPERLARFLNTRASFVAQTSLYGYLRTRAGMRYPELFDDDAFVEGINVAKWHIWLDCLGDLAVFAGARIVEQQPRDKSRVAAMMNSLVGKVLVEAGTPPDAGRDFAAHAARVRDRVARTNWLAVGTGEAAFRDSPASVVHWSPVMAELKQLDEEIVKNSVRFRWQEVRREFLRELDTDAVLAALSEKPPQPD